MSSDGDWGRAETPGERDRFDRWCADYLPLPDGDPTLDAFCDARRITPTDLARIGARWSPPSTVAYYYPEGVKTRDLTRLAEPGGGRAAERGASFTRLKLVRSLDAGDDPAGVILAEGETDAARLLVIFPDHDVAMLPAGAKGPTDVQARQVAGYPVVRVALDDDPAGNDASAQWCATVPRATRLKPPANDWCSSDEPDDGWASLLEAPPRRLFSIRELVDADLGTVAENHWFANGVLPVQGFQMIHAAPKSLKSFMILEEVRALASGTPFAGTHAFTRAHPARVLLYQYEVPPKDFQDRVMSVLLGIHDADERAAFLDNVTVRELANGALPRIKIGPGFIDDVRRDAEECDADVIVFDPFQKMTGSADANAAHELEPLFDAVDTLRARDHLTVIGLHHNNKAGRNDRDPLSMTGSQRFAADPDAIVSMWDPFGRKDDGSATSKSRNFGFELRNGTAPAGSITVAQYSLDNPHLVRISFGPALDRHDDPPDHEPAGPSKSDLF